VVRAENLIEQQAGVAVRRTPPDPVALLGDLDAAVGDLGAQFLAELRGAKPLELHVNGVERVVRAGHPQRRVDDLLPVPFALGTVRRRKVDVLKPPPPADVQAQDELKVAPLPDPVLHHVVEAVPALGR